MTIPFGPEEIGKECREVLDLIVSEFETDPKSVQCFDLRLVKRAIEAVEVHRRYLLSGCIR